MKFNKFIAEIKTFKIENITDIIFSLLDYDGNTRDNLINSIIETKERSFLNKKNSNFSVPPSGDGSNTGITYISLNSNSLEDLRKELIFLASFYKYSQKGNSWIGFGSISNSNKIVDLIIFQNEKWEYNKEKEQITKYLKEQHNFGSKKRYVGAKVPRNSKCPCGSDIKYKKCCAK